MSIGELCVYVCILKGPFTKKYARKANLKKCTQ